MLNIFLHNSNAWASVKPCLRSSSYFILVILAIPSMCSLHSGSSQYGVVFIPSLFNTSFNVLFFAIIHPPLILWEGNLTPPVVLHPSLALTHPVLVPVQLFYGLFSAIILLRLLSPRWNFLRNIFSFLKYPIEGLFSTRHSQYPIITRSRTSLSAFSDIRLLYVAFMSCISGAFSLRCFILSSPLYHFNPFLSLFAPCKAPAIRRYIYGAQLCYNSVPILHV